jgi:2-polyprenyl-3-methyl-5-hydroxy-6-metoxy-1,4-benzoquinol methylase
MTRISTGDYIHGGKHKDHYLESEVISWKCPLCNEDSYTLIDQDRGLGVVHCNSCNLIYTNPRVRESEENYFGDASVFFEEARLIFEGKRPHHRDTNYAYEIRQIKKFKSGGRLLDVGTNMGFFLRKARDAGFDVEGVEPSPSLASIASEQWQLKIHNSFLESAILPKETYDVITLIDVFEHVTDPSGMLKKCHELLKSDGIVAIKVPNGNYNLLKMKLAELTGRKAQHDIWDCYEHVVHYTIHTFKAMAKKNGFQVINSIIPKPIHPPVWAHYVGHYYQYPSPKSLDRKNRILRNLFYFIGKLENAFGLRVRFGPDLMFVLKKMTV